jgi:hypothetical protein
MDVVIPAESHLPSYVDALRRGWSPDNLRPEVARIELEAIERSASDFLASLDDPDGRGAPIQLPDGSMVQRLPGFRRWMWDGEFCGKYRLSMATRNDEASRNVPRAYRVCGSSLETRPRLCHRGPRAHARRGAPPRARLR